MQYQVGIPGYRVVPLGHVNIVSLQEYLSHSAVESLDHKYIIATNNRSGAGTTTSRNLLFEIFDYVNEKYVAEFSREEKYILKENGDTIITDGILNVGPGIRPLVSCFSPDGKFLAIGAKVLMHQMENPYLTSAGIQKISLSQALVRMGF